MFGELKESSFPKLSVTSPTSQLILQPFCRFTYVTAHEQSSFPKLSVTSPTSQLILQPFRRFTYVTAHSPTLPLLQLRHTSFSNPSFDSPTSQALHLMQLASRPWCVLEQLFLILSESLYCQSSITCSSQNITIECCLAFIIQIRSREAFLGMSERRLNIKFTLYR